MVSTNGRRENRLRPVGAGGPGLSPCWERPRSRAVRVLHALHRFKDAEPCPPPST